MTPSAPCGRSTPRPVAGCRSSCTSAVHSRSSPTISVGWRDEPVLVGLKDAFGDMRRFRRLREALGPRLTWIGASEDLLLAFWAYDADAVSPASLAYAPWYARRVWDALTAGRREEAVRLLRLFAWPVTDLRLSRPNIDITVVREFAAEFGLAVGEARPPAEPLTASERRQVRDLANILRMEEATTGMAAADHTTRCGPRRRRIGARPRRSRGAIDAGRPPPAPCGWMGLNRPDRVVPASKAMPGASEDG